jgi:tetratricopeptide (TPR) repeat protein
LSNKLKKKQQFSQKKNANSNYFMIGTIVFLVVIFLVMAAAVLKKDSPTGGVPDNSEITQIINRIETRLARLEKTPDDFKLMEDLGNDYYGAGFAYARAGNTDQAKFYWEEAIYYYLKVLDKYPDNINVRVDMATIAWRADRNDLAEENFKKAIEQNPNFFQSRLNFGNFYAYAKQDYAAAIVQWEEALKIAPNPQAISQLENSINDAKQQLQ